MKIAVLGTGLIGSTIAKDLASEPSFEVTAVDLHPEGLARLEAEANLRTHQADLQVPEELHEAVASSDLVACAVPGFMGFEVLKGVIEAGKDVVDISFFPEDAFALDELARARGVTAVVDCGLAPGLCNVLAGHVAGRLDRVDSYACYVGGLPKVRLWPYEYRVVFSAVDVIEEYTRPARLVEYGREVVRPALSEVESLDFPGLGTLEAFNTDGLRSLLRTLNAPFMKEKTLRYPGHAELMRVFRESGFFGEEPVDIEGRSVRPLDVTSKLLFDRWRLPEGEEDLTVMRVVMEGSKDGTATRHTFELLDRFDPATQTTSMARTTGYTCAIVVRQLAGKMFTQKGICPPEFVGGDPACFGHLLAELERRGVQLTEAVSEIGDS
ncbi:MAG: saccharopine dehydrogenase NADP-binding domain-containing protein [Trueperaceae bacterium]|nr:MAG: saccharopine dehydrogenase NADP-binding domain-containing protein [Trueperaceae bacterium]